MNTDDLTEDEVARLRDLRDRLSTTGIVTLPPTEEVRRRDPDSPPEDPRWVRMPDDVVPKRYVPDLSEVPPDPAEPVPRVCGSRLAGIDALIDYAASPDASLVPTPGPLVLTREQGTALLLALHRSGVEQDLRLTGANAPAYGDPPRIARPPLTDEEIETIRERLAKDGPQVWHYDEPAAWLGALLEERSRAVGKPSPAPAPVHGVKARILITDDLLADYKPMPPWPERDTLIARQQAEVFERLAEPRGALTYPDAGRVWLPPSLVVQAALVVDPTDPPEKP